MPRHACRHPGCPRLLTERGYCPKHAGKAEPEHRKHDAARDADHARRKAIYNSKQWQVVRAEVLEAEPICRECSREFATDVDHIKPLAAGGDPFDRDNLQPLCTACHRRKTARERREGLAGHRKPTRRG
ncbi:MAG: HNH endonuclease signature motif containing protein [Planctomycetota bacterium]